MMDAMGAMMDAMDTMGARMDAVVRSAVVRGAVVRVAVVLSQNICFRHRFLYEKAFYL